MPTVSSAVSSARFAARSVCVALAVSVGSAGAFASAPADGARSYSFPCRELAPGQTVRFDVEQAPLADVVRAAACVTGRNVLFDRSKLTATLTVVSTRRYSAQDLWNLAETGLIGVGMNLQRHGSFWRVEPVIRLDKGTSPVPL